MLNAGLLRVMADAVAEILKSGLLADSDEGWCSGVARMFPMPSVLWSVHVCGFGGSSPCKWVYIWNRVHLWERSILQLCRGSTCPEASRWTNVTCVSFPMATSSRVWRCEDVKLVKHSKIVYRIGVVFILAWTANWGSHRGGREILAFHPQLIYIYHIGCQPLLILEWGSSGGP